MHFSSQKLDFLAEMKAFITTRKRSLRRLCFYTCLSVHGGSTWGGTPLGRYTLATVHSGIRSTSGRYASHWNVFLFFWAATMSTPSPRSTRVTSTYRERMKREARGRCWTGPKLVRGHSLPTGAFLPKLSLDEYQNCAAINYHHPFSNK